MTGGDAAGSRYSPLADIHRRNVTTLKVAWTYRHGDFRSARGPDRYFRGTAFEATPMLVEGHLILTTPFNRVIALDPETGAEQWTFDPKIDKRRRFANMLINRGVAYWHDPNAKGVCASRVFLTTRNRNTVFPFAPVGGRPRPRQRSSKIVDPRHQRPANGCLV